VQIPVETVREVAQLLNESGLSEIAFETTGPGPASKLTLRRPAAAPASVPEADPVTASDAPTPVAVSHLPHPVMVTSTAVGVFRAPKPPLVAGDVVRRRQVVAVVESLKIPTEIYAADPARVVEVFVREGQGVEWGQPLLSLVLLED